MRTTVENELSLEAAFRTSAVKPIPTAKVVNMIAMPYAIQRVREEYE